MHNLESLVDEIQQKTGFDSVSGHSWLRLYWHYHCLQSLELGLYLLKPISDLPGREREQMKDIDIYCSAIEYFKKQYKNYKRKIS